VRDSKGMCLSKSKASGIAQTSRAIRLGSAHCTWKAGHSHSRISSSTAISFSGACTPSGYTCGFLIFQEKAFWCLNQRTSLRILGRCCNRFSNTWVCENPQGTNGLQFLGRQQYGAQRRARTCSREHGRLWQSSTSLSMRIWQACWEMTSGCGLVHRGRPDHWQRAFMANWDALQSMQYGAFMIASGTLGSAVWISCLPIQIRKAAASGVKVAHLNCQGRIM
jgi:hypothetical protein